MFEIGVVVVKYCSTSVTFISSFEDKTYIFALGTEDGGIGGLTKRLTSELVSI